MPDDVLFYKHCVNKRFEHLHLSLVRPLVDHIPPYLKEDEQSTASLGN